MNRQGRRLARKALEKLMRNPAAIPTKAGEPPIVSAAYAIVREYDDGPPTEAETAQSQDIAARLLPQLGDTWFHGGMPGRAVGDWLLRSGVTGAAPGDHYRIRRNFVYVSNRPEVASMYASERSGGVVYRVEPEFPLAVDLFELRAAMLLRRELKAEGLGVDGVAYCAFTCPRARVLEVIQ